MVVLRVFGRREPAFGRLAGDDPDAPSARGGGDDAADAPVAQPGHERRRRLIGPDRGRPRLHDRANEFR